MIDFQHKAVCLVPAVSYPVLALLSSAWELCPQARVYTSCDLRTSSADGAKDEEEIEKRKNERNVFWHANIPVVECVGLPMRQLLHCLARFLQPFPFNPLILLPSSSIPQAFRTGVVLCFKIGAFFCVGLKIKCRKRLSWKAVVLELFFLLQHRYQGKVAAFVKEGSFCLFETVFTIRLGFLCCFSLKKIFLHFIYPRKVLGRLS